MGTGSGDDDRTRLSFQPCAHTSGMPPSPISSSPPSPASLPHPTHLPAHPPYICTCPPPPARELQDPGSLRCLGHSSHPPSFLPQVRAAHMALSPGYQKEKLRPGRWVGNGDGRDPDLSATPDVARGLSSLSFSHPCSSPAPGSDLLRVRGDACRKV